MKLLLICALMTVGINILMTIVSDHFNLLLILDNNLFSNMLCYIFPSLFLVMLNKFVLEQEWTHENIFNMLNIIGTVLFSI